MARFLIIAGGSGIGQATAAMLTGSGHAVLTTARNSGRIAPDFVLDATDFAAMDAVFAQVGAIDGVVNFAGSLLLKPAHLTSREQYDDVIGASLTTAFATVRAAGKHMRSGSVVLISSSAAMQGLANHEAIAAAKAGIVGLARAAAATYAPAGLRVNVVAPGLTETPLTGSLLASDTSRKISEAMHPLGRLGRPEDVARAVCFLLDPDNSWITGEVLAVDGGLAHLRPKARA